MRAMCFMCFRRSRAQALLLFVALSSCSHATGGSSLIETSLVVGANETKPPSRRASPGSEALFLEVFGGVFSLRDGSLLDSTDTRAFDTIRASVRRLLDTGRETDVLAVARGASDETLLRVLFLAVAGEFTVSRSPSALPQRCALVVDASSGALVLKDSAVTQSVILEVLLIVSIVCLLRAWGDQRR